LVDHVAGNFGARHELALHWLYHEALCDDVEASTADVTLAPVAMQIDSDADARAVVDRLSRVPETTPLNGRIDAPRGAAARWEGGEGDDV
jgi:hypothetical protein